MLVLALKDLVDILVDKNALRIDISEEFNEHSVITVPKTLQQMFTIVPSKLRFVTLIAFLLKIFNNYVSDWMLLSLNSYVLYLLKKTKKDKTEAKVLLFFATNGLVRFHYDILNTILNGDKEDDIDEQEDLQFGHLLNQPVKLLRLQGDMTHQVSFSLKSNE